MILTPCWCEAFGFWLVGTHPTADFSSVIDMATSVRSLVDPEGNKTAVVVSWTAWEDLLAWLEEADDQANCLWRVIPTRNDVSDRDSG